MAANPRILANTDLVRLGTDPTYDPVLGEVSHNFEASATIIDATVKADSARYKLAGIPEYSFTVTCKLDQLNVSSVYTYQSVVAALEAGTVLDFQVGTTDVGDTIFQGTCVVASWSKSTDLDDVAEWTATFEVRTFSDIVNV